MNKTIEATIKTEPHNYAFLSGVLIGLLRGMQIEFDIADENQYAVNLDYVRKLLNQASAVIKLHEEASK